MNKESDKEEEKDTTQADTKNLEENKEMVKETKTETDTTTDNEKRTTNVSNNAETDKKAVYPDSSEESNNTTVATSTEMEENTTVTSTTEADVEKASSSIKKTSEVAAEKEQTTEEEAKTTEQTTKESNASSSSKLAETEADSSAAKTACKQIEIEDPDDYLIYLEVILKNIHERFYAIYDETQEIPDLKIIVPKIRSEVLRGQNLVFSGLVPTNMKLEQSRAYFIAKSLGANVSQNIGPDTTHLVAVTAGTYKVNAAKKNPNISIVNANWLWSCAERWEHVDEKVFPLDRKAKSKQRQPPAHCHSPEHVVNYSEKSEISSSSSAQQQQVNSEPEKFIDTINPLLSFSNADLADMNKEFDQFFESDSSSEDEHVNIENPPLDKKLRKRKREEREEDRTREFFTRTGHDVILNIPSGVNDADVDADAEKSDKGEELDEDKDLENEDAEDDDDDDEVPSAKFRRGEELPSDLEMGSESNDDSNNNADSEDDGDWNMMGAALEREFLGLDE